MFGSRPLPLLLAAALSASAALPPLAQPSSLTVPDQVSTIQAALDALVDTVLVRPGTYAESPLTRRSGWLMAAPGESEMPVLAGLTIQDAGDLVQVRGLRVVAQVLIRSSCCAEIRFDGCDLGGALDVSYEVKTTSVWFRHCSLGPTALAVRQTVRLDTCQVTGRLSVIPNPGDGCYLVAHGCSFQGDGTGAAIAFGNGSLTVLENTIRGYRTGVSAGGEYDVTILDNLIEDCTSSGIATSDPPYIMIRGNVIRRCGTGISAGGRGGMSIVGNTVEDAAGTGIFGSGEGFTVVGNVVSNCGGDGIRLSGGMDPAIVRQNTSCFNGGSGFVYGDYYPAPGSDWARNIGCGNGGYGASWLMQVSATVGCNDWFGNELGDVLGRPPSSSDISVDPQFCDPANRDFRLASSSPLLDWPGCGQVGALGFGCAETPTLVLGFTAARVSEGIRVVWEVAAGASATEVWLERSEAPSLGPWVRPVTERSFEGRVTAELDRSADPERTYWYRLVAREDGVTVVLGPPVEVTGAPRAGFDLALTGSNPGGGPVRVEFSLARPAGIEIDVVDVRGRRVASLARGPWPAGSHTVEWNGRAAGGGENPPGHYFVVYRYPGGVETRRLVRLF